MNFVTLVFEEHICHISHKETSMDVVRYKQNVVHWNTEGASLQYREGRDIRNNDSKLLFRISRPCLYRSDAPSWRSYPLHYGNPLVNFSTSPALYLPRMTSSEVTIALYFFVQLRFKPITQGEISIHVIIYNYGLFTQ